MRSDNITLLNRLGSDGDQDYCERFCTSKRKETAGWRNKENSVILMNKMERE